MLGHPALVAAEVGRDAQREALLAQQHVSAVAGVDRPDGVVLGEVADVSVVLIHRRAGMQALDEVAVGAHRVEHGGAHAGHDQHVEHDVDRVGQLNAVLGERAADNAHRVGDDVHRLAGVGVAEERGELVVALLRGHPVVRGAGVLLLRGADEGAVLYTRDVIDGGSVQIAARQLLLIELEKLAGRAGLGSERFRLLVGPVDENDLGRIRERDHFVEPRVEFGVLREIRHGVPPF